MPHSIRLRGFWETTAGVGQQLRHTRRFGKPTNLTASESVWLISETASALIRVSLNGEPLVETADGRFAVEVTARLLPRNELVITGEAPPPEEWRLEIRGPVE